MKMTMTHKLGSALVTAALAVGALGIGVSTATPASAAASNCPSGYASHQTYDFYDGSGNLAAVGYVFGYRDDVCTDLVARGSYYGQYKWMSDGIIDYPGTGTGSIWDNGYYREYAGPIQISDVYGELCKAFYFGMQDTSGNWIFNTSETVGCN